MTGTFAILDLLGGVALLLRGGRRVPTGGGRCPSCWG